MVRAAHTRTGTHPIDPEVGSSGMLGWVLPALGLAFRHVLTVAPASALVVTFILTMRYWVHWLPRNPGAIGSWMLDLLGTALGLAVGTFGFLLLCRKEGRPHGVGGHLSTGEIMVRLLPMLLFWALLYTVLGWLLGGMARSAGFQQMFGPLLMWLVRTFGLENGLLIVVWLISPLLVLIGTAQTLSNVMCVRSRLPLGEVLRESFSRVFGQLGRLILPCWVVVAGLLFLLKAVMAMLRQFPPVWMGKYPEFAVSIIVIPIITLAVAWWFVLERAYVPECGVEDDLTPPALPPPGAALHASDTAVEASNSAMALQVARRQIEQKLKLDDPDGAANYFVEWVSGRTRSVPDLQTLLPLFESHREVLLPRLSALVVDLVRNNRMFEAIELTRHGLGLEPRFLVDQPDMLPAYAKRLVASEQPDLALRLLATYVRAHRTHSGFLGGGLLLARLLMSHANQPEPARKLLEHLRTLHPTEPQIAILLRQLGPAP